VTEADPWAVVVRHGRWYLLCRAGSERAVRAYRVDRMRDVEPLDDPFDRPAGLDPVTMLEEHLAVGWEYAVEVVVEAPADRVRRYLSPALGRLEAVDAQHTRLVGSTSNPYWYAEQLAVIPAPFRVVGGVELRSTVATLGRRLLAASTVPD
jgi:predicted DNA-binding transcriptional regulator YafY